MTLSGGTADMLSTLAVAAAVGALLWALIRRSAKVGLVAFLLSVAFVPYWAGVTIAVYFPPACLVAMLVITAVRTPVPSPPMWADWAVMLLILLCVIPFGIGAGTRTTVFVALAHWGTGYLLGRRAPSVVDLEWIYKAIAVVFSVVAVLALVEFALSWNPFVLVPGGGPLQVWSAVQERGGILRAEGAFGHSIALGACLALAIPVTMACRVRPGVRAVMALLQAGAALVTFSRLGIAMAVAGIGLSLLLLPQVPTRLRVGIATAGAVLALVFSPRVLSVFTAAGTEASGSAAYRLDLTALLPELSPLGISDSAERDPGGTLTFGAFRSIDSAMLLLGLSYGALAMIVASVLCLGAVVTMLLGRATPPTLALVVQIPALLTVALITQYAILLWFFAGLAVASQAQAARRPTPAPRTTRSPTPATRRAVSVP
jgi:hypothetical protein